MIKADNLSFSFPEKELYKNISFTLEEGQHCAFIGTSGSGKTTLTDMIMEPDRYMFDGTLKIDPDYRIGYVSQFSQLDKTREITVFDYMAEEFIRLQNEITAICTEMETSEDIETLLVKYQAALDAFDAMGGDDYENNINKKLNLADLSKHETAMVSSLSGGEFKLIQVIKVMLSNPHLIIMDEPDAFLDFENINSLKNLINSHKGTLLIITHNRYLLDHCFDKILHLENKELQEFDGRFMDYKLSLLQTKIELQELAAADTAEIERNKAIINKLRLAATFHTEASRGKSLHAREKVLERLEARRIKAPFVVIRQPEIVLPDLPESEETTVLKVHDYSAAFDEVLLEHVSFEMKSTDKVALIGPNGTGKTTLLRDIYKNKTQSIQVGDQVKMAFLSQIQGEMLGEDHTVQDEFFEIGFNTYDEIKAHIAKYGFGEEVLTQKIGNLSGGEKNLLQLAKVSVTKANLLLLDEPTSHLDTYSQLALEEAIDNYKGAVLMVSHDFNTIANCADYVLMVEDKNIRKISIRKFRKMIYASHFNKDYIEIQDKKKSVETKIESALKKNDFELAKGLSEELERLIKLL
ncbi:ABC-F family ATP-binding cassette domain-containing protein [Lacrimispora sp. JR3]|uniref:ABC-F family ATP-binding cassette domain-containing protein n=1 Tax=Lacrimispora sinapis TaxID=3111456 RepID=UPI0037491125